MQCPTCDHDNIPGADQCAHCDMDLAGLDVVAWRLDPDDALLARPLGGLGLKTPLELSYDSTASEAMQLMRERREGCVFVMGDAGELLGIVTEQDLAARVAAPGRDPALARLGEIMTPDPVCLQVADPLAWALHRMGVDGLRHLPVMSEGKLRGFLSARTVLKVLVEP